MRLLNVQVVLNRENEILHHGPPTNIFEDSDDKTATYAILSHRWEDEVNYDEMTGLIKMNERYGNEVRQRTGYKKIIKSCKQALQDGYRCIWIDTCCIDRRSSSELSEAINSMYRWYRKSQTCYVYLNDVEDTVFPTRQDFHRFDKASGWPEWFSRGWTLQELIAPKQIKFFNKNWVSIGDKESLAMMLEKITRIPFDVLKEGHIPRRLCTAEIMSWAADRMTTRVEDRAYSLLGLFGVNMQILYGEGEKAFQRLQVEIIRVSGDHSIFAWNPKGQFHQLGSVLASSPSYFRGSSDVEKVDYGQFVDEMMNYRRSRFGIARRPNSNKLACLRSRDRALRSQLALLLVTNVGIQICLPVISHRDSESVFRAILACRDCYGKLITIDFITIGPSSYRIPATEGLRDSRPELRTFHLACSAPYSDEEQHHFKLDDRHATYYGFTRRGTFPREFTGDTVTFSSVTNNPVIIVYDNDDSRSRFAIALAYYLGQAYVHVADDPCSLDEGVSWAAFAKKAYDLFWVAPVECHADSGVKCAHLPRSIWDARVVWDTRNAQTDVMIDVEQCPGCCIGPRECTIAFNDQNNLDTPGFMQTVHNLRGLKLNGNDMWLCECSGQRITLGDYGVYSNGSFKLDGNIFEDMHTLGIDPADPAYLPVTSRVSSDAHILQHARDRLGVAVEFRPQGEQATLHPQQGLSLPNNQQLVLLLKALSIRLSNKHLVMATIQYSNPNGVDGEGRRRESEDSASTTGGHSTESSVFVSLYTIASPQVWRREPASARRRERFKTIRKHFYTLANLHRPPGTEVGHDFANRRMKRGAIKFLSDIFGLEILKNYIGEITFFKKFRSMMSIVGSGDGPSARPATPSGIPLKSRVGQDPRIEKVAPPLVEKCRAFGPLADFHQYLVARHQARCEVKSISQTLSVGLLEHIYTAILDASEDKTRGIRDITDARRVDIHSTLQEIRALQTTLDATDDEDEQRAFEEDVTGKILWISWCGIFSEVEQLLAELVNYIRRERDSMTPEGGDRFRQGLLEIGDIIQKATHHRDQDDDLTHLQRVMLDAGTGISRQQLWLAARIPKQTKQPSIPVGRRIYSPSEKSK